MKKTTTVITSAVTGAMVGATMGMMMSNKRPRMNDIKRNTGRAIKTFGNFIENMSFK